MNLSFALNYAVGGLDVWGYHAVNFFIHIFAGWTLFGFVRRTLRLPSLRERFGDDSWLLALLITSLWIVHPVQTESVTYIVQRAESLAGLFFLLTLYFFTRGITQREGRSWLWASVLSCAVGMGCKEIMSSAPLIALLYDRTFVAGTFAEAWRRRQGVYLALGSTWILLAFLIIATGNRGGSAGFGVGPSTLDYLLTQGCAIFEYLRLCVWPSPLIIDYGTPLVTDPARYLGPVCVIGAVGIASLIAVWRSPRAGFLGFCFFALLAPSSSIVVVATQTIAIHRMYLPIAVIMTALVLGLYSWKDRSALLLVPPVVIAFGWLTFERNKDYRSATDIFCDAIIKCPGNSRLLGELGKILIENGNFLDARIVLEESVRINAGDPRTHANLGIALYQTGSKSDGLGQLLTAFQMNPSGNFHAFDVGLALAGMGKKEQARKFLMIALERNPSDIRVRRALSNLDKNSGEIEPFVPSE